MWVISGASNRWSNLVVAFTSIIGVTSSMRRFHLLRNVILCHQRNTVRDIPTRPYRTGDGGSRQKIYNKPFALIIHRIVSNVYCHQFEIAEWNTTERWHELVCCSAKFQSKRSNAMQFLLLCVNELRSFFYPRKKMSRCSFGYCHTNGSFIILKWLSCWLWFILFLKLAQENSVKFGLNQSSAWVKLGRHTRVPRVISIKINVFMFRSFGDPTWLLLFANRVGTTCCWIMCCRVMTFRVCPSLYIVYVMIDDDNMSAWEFRLIQRVEKGFGHSHVWISSLSALAACTTSVVRLSLFVVRLRNSCWSHAECYRKDSIVRHSNMTYAQASNQSNN